MPDLRPEPVALDMPLDQPPALIVQQADALALRPARDLDNSAGRGLPAVKRRGAVCRAAITRRNAGRCPRDIPRRVIGETLGARRAVGGGELAVAVIGELGFAPERIVNTNWRESAVIFIGAFDPARRLRRQLPGGVKALVQRECLAAALGLASERIAGKGKLRRAGGQLLHRAQGIADQADKIAAIGMEYLAQNAAAHRVAG